MRTLAILFAFATSAVHAEDDSPPARLAIVPTPLQDDATLHDVTFVGSRLGWAVGDRGVLWHTADGGTSWSLLPTPVTVPLRSVCFLTDQIGWVAGGAAVPHSTATSGVLLFTRDGGTTWQRLDDRMLPRLRVVRFLGLREGLVVGDATAENPSGILTTRDGGATWQPVSSNRRESWRAAAFGSYGVGTLVGKHGRVAVFGEGRVLRSQIAPLGLRTVQAACMAADDTGWIVGDGGLVLRTRTGGVSWETPAQPLATGVADLFDFRAVSSRGTSVWIAGSPGSVVWHSPDAGRSWLRRPTGETSPIHGLYFTDERNGHAVGAFGTILRTADAGVTWTTVRGRGRRAAFLAVHAHPQRVSLRLLARESAERGYRSAVMVTARRDVGPNEDTRIDVESRLREAVAMLGGGGADVGWRLPIDLPGLDANSPRLVADWNRRSEGKLESVLVGGLVAAIRTWRPNVIVVDDPPPDDEATKLTLVAVERAVKAAADPTRFVSHAEVGNLASWRVNRVFRRLPPGSSGPIVLQAYAPLPRLGTSPYAAAARAESLFPAVRFASSETEAFRPLRSSGAVVGNSSFFAGLVIPPGGEARRADTAIDASRDAASRKMVERQRNLHAYARKSFDDPERAAAMLAQMRTITRGMPDEQTALLLSSIATEHRRRGQWELAEAAYVELLERFPREPVAVEAALWLFRLWTSTEAAWQRSRRVGTERQRTTTNTDAVVQRFQLAIRQARHERRPGVVPSPAIHTHVIPGATFDADPWKVVNTPGRLVESPKRALVNGQTWGADWRAGTARHWQRRAAWLASWLRENAPEAYRTAGIQFPLATLYRQRQAFDRADAIHRRFHQSSPGTSWQRLAETETWLLDPTSLPPRNVAVCRRTSVRPHLDGLLVDACWAEAKPLPLRATDEDDEAAIGGFVMTAFDDEYLYLAASLPFDPRLPHSPPSTAGRSHDADIAPFDRLAFLLDVDRDYSTWYDLRVDQRGRTRDACWGDTSWDPSWHVAIEHDDGRWQVEIAIPFEELVPHPPERGHFWALGLVRTIPAFDVESWTTPVTAHPRPETFGLLRFE